MKGSAWARALVWSHQAAVGFPEDVGSCRWKPSGGEQSPPQPFLTAQGSTTSHSPTALSGQNLFSDILPFLATLQQIS